MAEEMNEEQRKELLKKLFYSEMERMEKVSVFAPPQEGVKYRCPCCGYKTLAERGGYNICPVYFWEDDGQDEADVDTDRYFGPNHMSLAQGRENYRKIGACEERLLQYVRPPLPEEEEIC